MCICASLDLTTYRHLHVQMHVYMYVMYVLILVPRLHRDAGKLLNLDTNMERSGSLVKHAHHNATILRV